MPLLQVKYILSSLFSLLSLFVGINEAFSQADSSRHLIPAYPEESLHRLEGPPFAQLEKSIGLMPSIQTTGNLFVGMGIARGRFMLGEGGGTALGLGVGVDYSPTQHIWAPNFKLWTHGFAFLFGGNLGLSGIYYMDGQERNFVLRPEVGLGYFKLYLNYGYNFFLNEDFDGLSRHNFSLSYYHTLLPFKNTNRKK
ncbi:MAG: hypothetical protein MRZ79_15665 [Bacteroidia bacterium]|nr:hypothetical protein [Bacteroidia bacterium]